ncbi:MAG: HAD-IC family P-type ATPase, partial [Desulfuromonadales bacterium]|nr:HAD-IC family P-type ATPase [Desulfuromonadales bacterium]
HGVLLKGSQAMDSLARVDTLILDKTGTLTRGALKVTDVIVIDGMDENEVLALAAGAEEHYSHPMARAVLEGARQRGIELPPTGQVDFIVAHGVSAYINGARILVGSRHFVEDDEKIDCNKADELVDTLCGQGKTLLYVASEGRLAGLIALRDELRPEATSVLTALKQTGITKIVVLTGDNRLTAQALTRGLEPIDEIHWDLKPEEKAAIIKDLQEKGRRIAFAGDGVNDAPALVSADVGISMPGGADLAKKSAQVVLLREDLHCLLAGRLIALRTQSTLRNSFAATVGLNSAFLALASFGLIQPMTAAILHNSNTIGILGYAALAGTRRPGMSAPEDGDGAVLKHSDSSGTALEKENQHRS